MLLRSRHRAGWAALAVGIPALALTSAALHAAASGGFDEGVREHVETGEVSVSVVDDGPIRRLQFPGDLVQSEQDVRRPERLRLGYTHAIHGAACQARALEEVLLIGVGGGALVRSLHRVAPAAHVDAVELHRPVLDLARRWFGLPDGPWVDYHVDDGRRFLTRGEGRYDLIVLDAFGTERVPPHLLSREFMALARARLAPGGLLTANVIAEPGSELAEAVHGTAARRVRLRGGPGAGPRDGQPGLGGARRRPAARLPGRRRRRARAVRGRARRHRRRRWPAAGC